jgi:Tfp pilus assembly protein PilF
VPVRRRGTRGSVRPGLGLVTAVVAVVACGCSGGSSPVAQSKTDALLTAGLAAQQHGDLSTAKRDYQQVLNDEPGNVYAHFNLGVIAQNDSQSAAALGE